MNSSNDSTPPRAHAWTAVDAAEWKQSWRVVLGSAVGLGTGVNLYILVASIFIEPLTEAFGWTRGDLGLGGMISFITGAIMFPIVGRLTDRIGFRRVGIVGALGLAGVYVATALQPGLYWFYIALMVAGGVFGGATAAIVYTRPVIATFQRQRGLALGLATAGTSLTAIAAPPLLAVMIADYDWRAGFYTLATMTALIGLPIALALIGRAHERAARITVELADTGTRDVTLREALRDARFWLLMLALVCINIPGAGVLGQLAPLVADTGLPAPQVAIVMSIYSIGLLCGRLLTGFALDRLPAPWVGGVTTLVPAIGILMLMAHQPSFALLAVAVGLIGMQQGAETDLFAYFVSHQFGTKHYGAIFGAIYMAGAFSTAVALVLFGEVHDATGSYDVALTIGAVCFVLGSLAFAAIGRIRPPPALLAPQAAQS